VQVTSVFRYQLLLYLAVYIVLAASPLSGWRATTTTRRSVLEQSATENWPNKFLVWLDSLAVACRRASFVRTCQAIRLVAGRSDQSHQQSTARRRGSDNSHSPQPRRTPSAHLRSLQATRTHHGVVRFCGRTTAWRVDREQMGGTLTSYKRYSSPCGRS
jgi:hypothetical protein